MSAATSTRVPDLLERLRHEHRAAQAAYLSHERACNACRRRKGCSEGEDLEIDADASGNALDAEQARADAAAGRA